MFFMGFVAGFILGYLFRKLVRRFQDFRAKLKLKRGEEKT